MPLGGFSLDVGRECAHPVRKNDQFQNLNVDIRKI